MSPLPEYGPSPLKKYIFADLFSINPTERLSVSPIETNKPEVCDHCWHDFQAAGFSARQCCWCALCQLKSLNAIILRPDHGPHIAGLREKGK